MKFSKPSVIRRDKAEAIGLFDLLWTQGESERTSFGMKPLSFSAKVFCTLLSLIFLVSCVSDKNPGDSLGNEAATFDVEEVKANVFVASLGQGGLPSKKTFQFSTCVKSRFDNGTLQFQDFYVKTPHRNYPAPTDAKGCLTWYEEVEFPIGRAPIWVQLNRSIVAGKSRHKGSVPLRLAINPWLNKSDKVPALVDLTSLNEIPEFLKGRLIDDPKEALEILAVNPGKALKFSDRPQLWVENIKIAVREGDFKSKHFIGDDFGARLKLTVEFEPTLRVKNVKGVEELVAITGGDIAFEPFLLSEKPGEASVKYILNEGLRAPGHITEKMTSSYVRREIELKLPFIPNSGVMSFGLKAWLPGHPNALRFEGFFNIGSAGRALGEHRIKVSAVTLEKYREALKNRSLVDSGQLKDPGQKKTSLSLDSIVSKDGRKYAKDAEEETGNLAPATYRLSASKANFIGVDKNKCETIVRKIRYQVRTCIYNPFTRRGLPNTWFKIYRVDPSLVTAKNPRGLEAVEGDPKNSEIPFSKNLRDREKSDPRGKQSEGNGCIIWEHSQQHGFYDRQNYFVNDFIFVNEELGIWEKAKIAVNPWDPGFTFAFDAKHIKGLLTKSSLSRLDAEGDAEGRKPSAPRLVIHDFKATLLGLTYDVDDNLDLVVNREFRYGFSPRVTRYDSIKDGIQKKEGIRDGAYILKVALARHSQDSIDQMGRRAAVKHKRDLEDEMVYEENFLNPSVNPPKPNILPELIAYRELPVTVRDGVVKAIVKFRLEDIYTMGSRNGLFVEMVPADPEYLMFQAGSGCDVDPKNSKFVEYTKSDLEIRTYGGQQVARDLRRADMLWPVGFRIADLIKADKKRRIEKSLRPLGALARSEKRVTSLDRAKAFARFEGLKYFETKGNRNSSLNLNRFYETLEQKYERLILAQERLTMRFGRGKTPLEIGDERLRLMGTVPFDSFSSRSEQVRKMTGVFLSHQLNSLPSGKASFRDMLAKGYFPKFSKKDLRNWVEKGLGINHPMDAFKQRSFSAALCGFWADDFYSKHLTQEAFESARDFAALKNEANKVNPNIDRFGKQTLRGVVSPQFKTFWKGTDSQRTPSEESLYQLTMVGSKKLDLYRTCLSDPDGFFTIDRKTIVGELAREDLVEIPAPQGDAYAYNIQQSFRIDSSLGWQRSRTTSFGQGYNFINKFKIRLGYDFNTSFQNQKGNYRGQSAYRSDSSGLIVARNRHLLPVKSYRNCLAIRPRKGALAPLQKLWIDGLRSQSANQLPYERSGLLVCTPERVAENKDEVLWLNENYFFIFQHFFASNALQDRDLIRNRPIMIFLRGLNEFAKFNDWIGKNLEGKEFKGFDTIPLGLEGGGSIEPNLKVIETIRSEKKLKSTGFFPGVHHDVAHDSWKAKNLGSIFSRALGELHSAHYLGFIPVTPGQKSE